MQEIKIRTENKNKLKRQIMLFLLTSIPIFCLFICLLNDLIFLNQIKLISFTYPTITFITVPSPRFSSLHYKIHKFAVNSWIHNPEVQVVLFTHELNDTMKHSYSPKIKICDEPLQTGPHGNPLIRDWFIKGHQFAQTDYIAFINSDIIISETFVNVTLQLLNKFKEETFIGIARMNIIEFNETVFDFNYSTIDEQLSKSFALYRCEGGGDIFIFSKHQKRFNLSTIPDFEVGFCTWDNFLYYLFSKFPYSITYNFNPPVYHIYHGPNKCTEYQSIKDVELIKKAGFDDYKDSYHNSLRWGLDYGEGCLRENKNIEKKICL